MHSSSVYKAKSESAPFRSCDEPIPRCSGTILYDRSSFADDSIEEGTLPHVGATDKGHEW